jgi:hypothetical protein
VGYDKVKLEKFIHRSEWSSGFSIKLSANSDEEEQKRAKIA